MVVVALGQSMPLSVIPARIAVGPQATTATVAAATAAAVRRRVDFMAGTSVIGSGRPSFGTVDHRGSRRCSGSVDRGGRETGEDRGRAPQDGGGCGSNHGTDDDTTR